jgi:hypothetical protein
MTPEEQMAIDTVARCRRRTALRKSYEHYGGLAPRTAVA